MKTQAQGKDRMKILQKAIEVVLIGMHKSMLKNAMQHVENYKKATKDSNSSSIDSIDNDGLAFIAKLIIKDVVANELKNFNVFE